METGNGLMRQGAWNMEKCRKKNDKGNKTEWLGQVEGGTVWRVLGERK